MSNLATFENGRHQSAKHHIEETKQLEGVEAYTRGTLELLKERNPEYYAMVTTPKYVDEKQRAIDYARRISNGATKAEAYCKVLGIDWSIVGKDDVFKRWLNTRLWRYEQLEIVVKEIEYVQLSMHRLFHDKHIKALHEQFNLGMTARSEKVRADALHQFIQNTRNPLVGKPTDQDIAMVSESRQLLDSITNAFNSVRKVESVDGAYPQVDCAEEKNPPSTIFANSQNLAIDVVPLKDSL